MGVSDMSDENMPPMSLLGFSWLALLLSQYMQLLLSVMAPLPGCVIFIMREQPCEMGLCSPYLDGCVPHVRREHAAA
jgi:hypothetical protein